MRLLIVGASGFLGRNLVDEVAEGHYPFDVVTATFVRDESFTRFAAQRGIEAVRYDVLADAPPPSTQDVCIYLAGNSDHALAIHDPVADLRLNTQAVLRFVRCFDGHLVYLSSGAVYYGLRGQVSPDVAVAPTFAYGVSKLAGEHYVRAFCDRGRRGASHVILRLFYAYGRYDKPRRLIPQVVNALLFEHRDVFHVRGDGRSLLDPLEGRDVARALVKAALCPGRNVTLDLCGGQHRTVIDVVRTAARSLGRTITVATEDAPEPFPVDFRGSPEPAEATLGLKPPTSLEEGVRAYASWLASEGKKGADAP